MHTNFAAIRRIFQDIVERPAAQWDALLDEACAGDAEVRRQAAALLKAHADSAGILDRDLAGKVPTDVYLPAPEGPGTVIGPYKLMEQIGEGGFGVVFMAEQTEPIRRKVAVKVLKPGMDTKQVIARFEAERQALALMDHPNIAKVLEAGQIGERRKELGDRSEDSESRMSPNSSLLTPLSSSRPYFVMELVRGLPITDFCDEGQLTTRERLELFAHVCRAVQHAHQKGIIHRDIKPSNVLVTMQDGNPLVKVIDFGIAKALGQQLTDKTLFTGFAQMIGTPLYMSPEQAALSNVDVDTRSDIYSLGVLLYELLTGTTPFDKERLKTAGYDEFRRILREEEPPKPSTRFSTLGQAASTVSTQRKSDPKRLSQILRGELDWIVMKALDKDRGRRYETASAFAADVDRYLRDEAVEACPPSAWYRFRKFTRRHKAKLAMSACLLTGAAVLAAGLGWNLSDRAARNSQLKNDVQLALQLTARQCDAGDWPAARQTVLRAQSLLAAGFQEDPLRQQIEGLLADLDMVKKLEGIRLAQLSLKDDQLDWAEADAAYEKAFRAYGTNVDILSVEEAAAALGQKRIQAELVAALDNWAAMRHARGNSAWKHLLCIAAELHRDNDRWRERLRHGLEEGKSQALLDLAADAEQYDPSPGAVSLLVRAVETTCEPSSKAASGKKAGEIVVGLLLKSQRDHPDDFWINFQLAYYLHKARPPHLEKAIRYYSVALALRPHSPVARCNLGVVLYELGHYDDALAFLQKAKDLAPDSARIHFNLGQTFRGQGRWDEAIREYREASRLAPDLIESRLNLAKSLDNRGHSAEAEAEYRAFIRLNPTEHRSRTNLGSLLAKRGELKEAEDQLRQALLIKHDEALIHSSLGYVLNLQKRSKEAEHELREAIRLNPDDGEAHNRLGYALGGQGR